MAAVIGQRIPPVGGRAKVLGEAQYVADLQVPRMLHAKVMRSPHPHARIVSIDTSRARRLPGVKAVITGADVPATPWGLYIKDQHILAREKVRYAGDEVAAVAAVDEDTALDALELIRVEYAPLPAVLDPEEALAAGAPLVHERGNLARTFQIERGNVEDGFARADVIHEETYETSRQYQAFTEPMGSLASADASGRVTVWAPAQSIFLARQLLADAMGLAVSSVRVIQTTIGGGFGGKIGEDRNMVIAAWLARAAGRPVRLINTRIDDFLGCRSRYPARIRLRMGVMRSGELVAKDIDVLGNNGAYTGFTHDTIQVTATRTDSVYRYTNVRARARLAYTNTIAPGAFRGFGSTQGTFAVEQHLDALAERIGMDPVELRLKNATQTGDTSVHGWKIGSCALSECIRRAATAIGYREKRGTKRSSGSIRRGVGLASGLHITGNRHVGNWDGSSIAIKLNEDGRAQLICGEGDLGQGALTMLSQIAASELGLPIDHVTISVPDTDSTPYCLGAWASRLTMVGGNAVLKAARTVKAQVLEIAAEKMEVAAADLRMENGVVFVTGAPDLRMTVAEICAAHLQQSGGDSIFYRATHDAPTVMADKKTLYGNISSAYSFVAQAAEVEVDTETGQVRVVDFVSVDDVGKALNPLLVEAQIEGAVVQGMGYALFEQLHIENGRLVNGNFADYTVPSAAAVPRLRTELVETIDPNGPHGAKGASEAPIVTVAPAIANAVYDAIGVRITTLPITAEKVLDALRARAATGAL
jgi:CO/xanthine dehydrogenase Mo-binding subunit